MSQLRHQQERLASFGVDTKLVSFDDDFLARAYVETTRLDWPLLLDNDRSLYSAYGMESGNWWNLYSPLSIFKYLWLIARGRRPGKPGSDWRQLGGDVLIDPLGIVRLHHVSANPHDRPSLEQIFGVLEGKAILECETN